MAPGVYLALLLLLDVVEAVLFVQEKLAAFGAFHDVAAVRVAGMVHELLIIFELLMAVVAVVFLVVEETHERL